MSLNVGGYSPLAVVAENSNSALEVFWVHGNHLGVPLLTTNAQGQVVTPANDFLRPGFPGQSQVLSDLYYNRARDYDPLTGRYIQADPIGLWGGSNPYLYAEADPINMIDPTGEVPAPLLIGGALAIGNLAYQLYENGGRIECVDPLEVVEWGLSGTGVGGLASNGLRFGGRRALRNIWRDQRGGGPGRAPRGMHNPKTREAVERGQRAHKDFASRVRNKQGWDERPRIVDGTGRAHKPDALTPSGRPIELKPNTASGRKRGAEQIKRYKEVYDENGRVIYYDPLKY